MARGQETLLTRRDTRLGRLANTLERATSYPARNDGDTTSAAGEVTTWYKRRGVHLKVTQDSEAAPARVSVPLFSRKKDFRIDGNPQNLDVSALWGYRRPDDRRQRRVDVHGSAESISVLGHVDLFVDKAGVAFAQQGAGLVVTEGVNELRVSSASAVIGKNVEGNAELSQAFVDIGGDAGVIDPYESDVIVGGNVKKIHRVMRGRINVGGSVEKVRNYSGNIVVDGEIYSAESHGGRISASRIKNKLTGMGFMQETTS